jgi:hypothetical protein
VRSLRLATLGALALAAASGPAFAQGMPEGRVYTFHSTKQGGCPALDWHVVVGANGALDGMIAWNDMKQMAHATGTVNMQARTFQMSAKEVGGQNRTATVTGTVGQNGYLTANVHGPNVDCQGITVPWFTPPPANG